MIERPVLTEVATGLRFPEGPIALPDGDVLVVEIARRTLTRIVPDGRKSVVAELGGGPNGAAIGPDGACYVCNNGGFRWVENDIGLRPAGQAEDYCGGSIQRVDLTTGAFTTLYEACDGRRLSAPNDIVFDRSGGFWFTDPGAKTARQETRGAIFYATVDGQSITEVLHPLNHPNGIGLSADERTLYFSETQTGRVWQFEITAPGRVKKDPRPYPNGGRLLTGLPGFELLDSLALDSAGNVCVASPYRGAIVVIAPDGRVLRYVEMDDLIPTNICFGGPGLRSAFATLCERGRLVRFDWPVAGLPLNFLNT